jgi:hypothetical protein
MAAGIEPLIAMGRQAHHPPLSTCFVAVPPPPQSPTPVQAMAHRLNTPQGRTPFASYVDGRCDGWGQSELPSTSATGSKPAEKGAIGFQKRDLTPRNQTKSSANSRRRTASMR